jgi:hypothetical protein
MALTHRRGRVAQQTRVKRVVPVHIGAWNEEGVARPLYRYANVLDHLYEPQEAEKMRMEGKKTREEVSEAISRTAPDRWKSRGYP